MQYQGSTVRPAAPGRGRRQWLSVWLLAAVVVLAVAACGSPSREELAALAAKGYYDHLLAGDYDAFLQGKAGADSLPADYREQLLTAYKQYMGELEQQHRGLRDVRVATARTDSATTYTSVFLVLCFGDSTVEEVVVPMVEAAGSWRMQ